MDSSETLSTNNNPFRYKGKVYSGALLFSPFEIHLYAAWEKKLWQSQG